MDAGVFGEFGVEGCRHRSSLPDRDWQIIFAFGCNDLDARTNVGNLGGADEDHFERSDSEFAFADGAIELASVGVAADADVDGAEAGLLGVFDFGRQQDCAGAGAEGGLQAHELLQLFEAFLPQQFQERSGLASGDDEAVDFVELLGLFYEHNFGAQLFEPAAVGVEIALQGQDTDGNPRRWSLVVSRWQKPSRYASH